MTDDGHRVIRIAHLEPLALGDLKKASKDDFTFYAHFKFVSKYGHLELYIER